jgi:hypothetical protein
LVVWLGVVLFRCLVGWLGVVLFGCLVGWLSGWLLMFSPPAHPPPGCAQGVTVFSTVAGVIGDSLALATGISPEDPVAAVLGNPALIAHVPAVEVQGAQGYSAVAQELRSGRVVLLHGARKKGGRMIFRSLFFKILL